MRLESFDFLRALVNVPSPSGYEEEAAVLYREYVANFADEVRTDVLGNVWAIANPAAPMKIMLSGHMDEIGFVVHYISENGLLYFKRIGGHDSTIAVGQRVWVHGRKKTPGVIGRKAIHLLELDEGKQAPEFETLWIDIGAASRAEAQEVVELGDAVTYQWEFEPLTNSRATARGFDNKMGCFIVAEALRLAKPLLHPQVGVYAVATVQEEVGYRGAHTAAFGIAAQTGLAVDVSHATDYPTVEKEKFGDLSVGKGPVITRGANINPIVFRTLVAAAKEENIPYQVEVEGESTGTDAEAMETSRSGMATGLLGVATRYMHTPCELLDLEDVENCARLMAAYCRSVKPDTDFTPHVFSRDEPLVS